MILLKQIFWRRALIEITVMLLIAIIIGIIYQHILLFITIGLGLALLWNIYQLHKLSTWIWWQNSWYPPTSVGSTNTLFYGLHKRQQRIRQKYHDLAQILRHFRHGSEAIPDALVLTNQDGKIVWCNKIAQYQLGIRWPDDKGQNIINLVRLPEFARYMHKKVFDHSLTLLFNKSYSEFRVIAYSDNHWLVIVRDVDQLYLAEKQRHDFFTNASHELRTPLTVIKGYLSMLSEDMIPIDKQPQIIDTMQAQLERMESLVSQILLLSQIENNPIKHQLQPVAMAEILHNIVKNIGQIYPQYSVTVNIDEQLHIIGHKEQLYSAVSNLIYNAVKHNPAGTHITIYWQKTAQGAYFSVTDNGPGIPTNHLHRLTERFYQVDSARTHKKDSSGLGLAIVKHALLNHANTKLMIQSELGKGSCFSFTLPNQYIDSD